MKTKDLRFLNNATTMTFDSRGDSGASGKSSGASGKSSGGKGGVGGRKNSKSSRTYSQESFGSVFNSNGL